MKYLISLIIILNIFIVNSVFALDEHQCIPLDSINTLESSNELLNNGFTYEKNYIVNIENGDTEHAGYIVGYYGTRTTDKINSDLAPKITSSHENTIELPNVRDPFANSPDSTNETFTITCKMWENYIAPMDMGFYVYYPDTDTYAVLRLYLRGGNISKMSLGEGLYNNDYQKNALFTLSTNKPLRGAFKNEYCGKETINGIDCDARNYPLTNSLEVKAGTIHWFPTSDPQVKGNFPFDIPLSVQNEVKNAQNEHREYHLIKVSSMY